MSKYRITYSSPDHSWIKNFFIQLVEYLTGRLGLERRYRKIIQEKGGNKNIWELFAEKMELTSVIDQKQLDKIPKQGPLVFIANHPYGVVDGILFGLIVSKIRKHFKFLVNDVLYRDEDLNEYFLPISFDESREAIKRNIKSKNEAINVLNSGEPILIFPGGGVATAKRFFGKAEELEWKPFVAKLIQQSQATVIPIYFPGQNSRLFQIVSILSMDFRIALLLNEVRNKLGTIIKVEIGNPILFSGLPETKNKQEVLMFLYTKILSLKNVTPEYSD